MLKKSLVAALALSSSSVMAADITITNLTQGIFFTPLLVTAHSPDASLFDVGEAASPQLQTMAEGGSIDGLLAIVDGIGADTAANPAGGLLAPGASTTATIEAGEGNTVLSVVAMLLPTNDGFVGLDNWTIPTEPGSYTVYLNGYDAGTEANDELRGSGAPGEPGMPVPPPLDPLLGTGGTGVTAEETNQTVHIHRGNLGDDDISAGTSDVQNNVHRWLNPVARLTVVVN